MIEVLHKIIDIVKKFFKNIVDFINNKIIGEEDNK